MFRFLIYLSYMSISIDTKIIKIAHVYQEYKDCSERRPDNLIIIILFDAKKYDNKSRVIIL